MNQGNIYKNMNNPEIGGENVMKKDMVLTIKDSTKVFNGNQCFQLDNVCDEFNYTETKTLSNKSQLVRKKRKMAEKEFDKKYREMNEREYESYRERETKKKMVKNQKMQNYRKMLDEQIEQKKKLMFKNDMNNQPFSLEMFS